MNSFILACRELLVAGKIARIVLGNPTADMDSCIGSILLAYYYHQQTPTAPVINFQRHLFSSHFEVLDALPNWEQLLFLGDLDVQKYEIVLYDHNDCYYPTAIGCVDHHDDKGLQFKFKLIEKVGSATTLVGEMLRNDGLINREIAQLIMKTQLVDTFNFDPAQESIRWTQKDLEVFNFCKQFDPSFNPEQEYRRLTDLKYDIKLNLQMPLSSMLLKDYKAFGKIGYSVVFLDFPVLLARWPELTTYLELFRKENSLMQLIVFFVHQEEGKIKRKMLALGDF